MHLPELSAAQWLGIQFGAVVVGFTKTGIPGLGMVAVSILAGVLPARMAVGVTLPMLIFGDLFAFAKYRRAVVWRRLLPLIPWAAVGILAGVPALDRITDRQLRPVVGCIVLAMLGMQHWQRWRERRGAPFEPQWYIAAVLGIIAGFTTMLANSAGPVMAVYLLAMRLPKAEFMGTGAWYFLLMNWFKVPFHLRLGTIDAETFALSATCFPAIAVGALLGFLVLKHIRQEAFNRSVEILTALAAAQLLLR